MIFVYIAAILWIARIIGNLITYVHLWWVKEYRFDRMFIHLRTAQGKKILIPSWRRPPVTPKTVGLVTTSGLVLLALFYVLPLPVLVRLLVVDIATFPLTWLLVGLLKTPTIIYHETLINLAIRKLKSHPPMTVVGITGSYGKTSTKDYLATILEHQFKVIKTEASKNSPIAIAEVVLSKLRPEHQVFVVEMGAYKRKEIARMAAMVNPQIGIITAINPQHQDLFGTIENTMKAKYELIEGLSEKQIGIFNADDERVRQMADWARTDGREVWGWSKKISNIKYQISNKRTFMACDINATLRGVEFVCILGNEKVKVNAPVLGEHQVSNILAAIAGAVACGMKFADAARAASHIKPVKKVMELLPGVNGSRFINDTFNNNPDAALAALAFLAKAQGGKFLVFQPMIELGDFADSAHEGVGNDAARVCHEIILTNNNFHEPFMRGVSGFSKDKKVLVLAPRKAAEYIRGRVKKGDIVLFKGKEAELVFQRLMKR